jgi:hypothetical protein
MKEGDKVIILFNPHHKGADKIIGTVRAMQPRPGGLHVCDLAYVEYRHPEEGRMYTLPFGLHNLQLTSEANLIWLAEHHEALAKEYRELAQAADKKE